ncbi:MAG: hypothetical protein EXR72_21395 [Myxococcales bacterium]|nr:hypothetical protein [Myxococcales bacterium]
MPDQYIDPDEILIYGPFAAHRMVQFLERIDPACSPIVRYFARKVDEATAAVQEALACMRERPGPGPGEDGEPRTVTPEVAAARAEWLRLYGATKDAVASILRLHGRPDLMPRIFHDLALPASTKVTSIPDDGSLIAN